MYEILSVWSLKAWNTFFRFERHILQNEYVSIRYERWVTFVSFLLEILNSRFGNNCIRFQIIYIFHLIDVWNNFSSVLNLYKPENFILLWSLLSTSQLTIKALHLISRFIIPCKKKYDSLKRKRQILSKTNIRCGVSAYWKRKWYNILCF